ncbi:MAG: hypothetical protein U5K69_06725 [Balneolaceae bacterium]|nr:hypothetical protein [Balneolaceae bacterium]
MSDPEVLVWGLSTLGMTPDSPIEWEQSAMPLAWTRQYISPAGNTGRVFTTTMGASVDLLSEDLRRLIVNGCYWALGLDRQIPEESNVELPGSYDPTMFGFGDHQKEMHPADFKYPR